MSTINHTFRAKNSAPRNTTPIKFLVLHYTAVPLGTTLGIFTNDSSLCTPDLEYFTNSGIDPHTLCQRPVSVHYVNSEAGEIFQLVNEHAIANHAGPSFWNGVENLNAHSIGIELVNFGYDWLNKFPEDRAVKVTGSDYTWCAYTQAQIASTIELCHAIIQRHNILSFNVVGHSDIACGIKLDPGPLFPWQSLAQQGIGMWHDVAESSINQQHLPDNPVLWMQQKLCEYGYACPQTGTQDPQTTAVLQSMQMHFRPSNISGKLDLECMQIIDSLCQRKLALETQTTKHLVSV